MDIAPGAVIGEHRLEARLGGGAFGSVWRAEHVTTGDVVAIKLLTGVLASDARGDIRREIEVLAAMASTRSPHVVRVLGGGAEPVPHIIMEFIDGSDLAARLRDNHHLPVEETIEIGLAIAGALAVLKEAGIIHRDVKPANVLIGRDGTARLADFGIAKIVGFETITMTGQLPMTMAYAAPEVWDGRATHHSDLYAMGVLLYQCLAGATPFSGTYGTLFRQHTTVAPDLTRLPPDIPTHLRALIAACLQKQPGARPADATACIAMLEDARRELGDPSSVEPATALAFGVASVEAGDGTAIGGGGTTIIRAPLLRDETAIADSAPLSPARSLISGDEGDLPPRRPRQGISGWPNSWRLAGIGVASLGAAAIAALVAMLMMKPEQGVTAQQPTATVTATRRLMATPRQMRPVTATPSAPSATSVPRQHPPSATSTAIATATASATATATATPTMPYVVVDPFPTATRPPLVPTQPPLSPATATFTPTYTPTVGVPGSVGASPVTVNLYGPTNVDLHGDTPDQYIPCDYVGTSQIIGNVTFSNVDPQASGPQVKPIYINFYPYYAWPELPPGMVPDAQYDVWFYDITRTGDGRTAAWVPDRVGSSFTPALHGAGGTRIWNLLPGIHYLQVIIEPVSNTGSWYGSACAEFIVP